MGLSGCHSDRLDSCKGEYGRCHDTPEAEKLAPFACADILDEWARILPILEADAGSPRNSTKINDQSENNEKNNQEDLQDGKEELDLAEDPNKSHADDDSQEDENDDPKGAVDVGPELKKDADGCDFGGNAEKVPINKVPPDGKFERWIYEEASMSDKTSCNLQPISCARDGARLLVYKCLPVTGLSPRPVHTVQNRRFHRPSHTQAEHRAGHLSGWPRRG